MSGGCVLTPGALVQHEDGRVAVIATEPKWVPAIGMRHRAYQTKICDRVGGCFVLIDPTDLAWSLVGETGKAPEGAVLAWVTEEFVNEQRRLDDEFPDLIQPGKACELAVEFCELNPVESEMS